MQPIYEALAVPTASKRSIAATWALMQPSPDSPHPYSSDRQLTLLLTRISANPSDSEVNFGEFCMLYKGIVATMQALVFEKDKAARDRLRGRVR